MNPLPSCMSDFLEKKGIASAFAQANRSLIERNKVLQSEALASKAEAERLRKVNAELRAAISILESGFDDERIKFIVERHLKDKLLKLRMIARRAVDYMGNIIKEFESVLVSRTLMPEVVGIAGNVPPRRSILTRPELDTVQESPNALLSVMRELPNIDGKTVLECCGKSRDSDIVNDSLEDRSLTYSSDNTINDRTRYSLNLRTPSTFCEVDLGSGHSQERGHFNKSSASISTSLVKKEANERGGGTKDLSLEEVSELQDDALFAIRKHSFCRSVEVVQEPGEDSQTIYEEHESFFRRRYFEPTQRRNEHKSGNSSELNLEQSCNTVFDDSLRKKLPTSQRKKTSTRYRKKNKKEIHCSPESKTNSGIKRKNEDKDGKSGDSDTPCRANDTSQKSACLFALDVTEGSINSSLKNSSVQSPLDSRRRACRKVQSYKTPTLREKIRRPC